MLQLHASRLAGPARRLASSNATTVGSARLVTLALHQPPRTQLVLLTRFTSTTATSSSATAAVIHKPIPAKLKRKASTRGKKKHPAAAAIASKLNGSASELNGSAAIAKDEAVAASAPAAVAVAVVNATPAPATARVNGQKQSEEEAALLRAAKQPNGTSSSTRLNGNAAVAPSSVGSSHSYNDSRANIGSSQRSQSNNHYSHSDSRANNGSSHRYKKQQHVATSLVEKDNEASDAVASNSATAVDVVKKPSALKDVATDKITLTLKEIQSLQKTLPSVEEIAALVDRLRRDSFLKGHTLFDLYRNYGNPFLDENFLIPGVLACCEAKKPADGIRIVRDMLNQGRKVDEKTLRALFDVCDDTSAASEVVALWELMDRAGMKLELRDYNRFLDICYRKEYLDGAIKVLKHLRLLRPVSVHTYMHWLLRASLVWRSDAFFDILMEMRLSGVEPEISSLTSLETGRMDRALTVMEGVRAVGLDPCFAMSSVYSSMQSSVYSNGPSSDALTPKDIKDAKSKFGDLKPMKLEWPVKPIPQLLETQAAGLILRQETFRRLKRHQVNRIDELLQMLPITANMTLNLRKQLQRMSLLVNTHRVRRNSRKISDEYMSGKTLIELSTVHNYPPVSLMRIILRERGLNTIQVKRALNSPSENLAKRDQYEIRKAVEYDSVHKSDPFIGVPSYNAESLEVTIEHFMKAQGIRVK